VTPDVTLVMPVWRPRVDWFRHAVESALAQEDCLCELVVVDDGNDEPVDALLSGVSDGRVSVVRVRHGGQAAACNAGIDRARGRYVRFVDADDALEPGSTARLLRLAAGRDDVISYGFTVVCDAELEPRRTIASLLEGDVVEACLLGRFDVRHESLLFPQRVIALAGNWADGFAVSADWDFTLRALEHAAVRLDPEPATFYRRHGESMTGVASVAAGEADRLRIVERFFERHPGLRGKRLERRAYASLYRDSAVAYAHLRNPRSALDRLVRSGRQEPLRAIATLPRLVRISLG